MYQQILVPFDMAHPDRGKTVVALAKSLGGEDANYKVLNVVEEIPAFVALELPESFVRDARADALSCLRDLAAPLGPRAEVEVLTGHAANTILEAAKSYGADVIIVGSHKPGLEDYFIGSTAARVVRHAKCAVLVDR